MPRAAADDNTRSPHRSFNSEATLEKLTHARRESTFDAFSFICPQEHEGHPSMLMLEDGGPKIREGAVDNPYFTPVVEMKHSSRRCLIEIHYNRPRIREGARRPRVQIRERCSELWAVI